MTSTFCPAVTWPTSVRACRAVTADTGTTAACSKDAPAGLRASLSSRAAAYSAKVPRPKPNTSSPTGTWSPPSRPRRRCRRRRARAPGSSVCGARPPGAADTAGRSSGARCPGRDRPRAPAAAPRGRRSRAGRSGASRRTSAEPYPSCTIACIVLSAVTGGAASPLMAVCCRSVPMTAASRAAEARPLAVLSTARYSTKYERAIGPGSEMSEPVSERPAGRPPLSRERVLRGAVAVADAGGIGALTIRSLASELGVKPMSVYHYVASKDEILDGIVDLVFSEIELPAAGGDWRSRDAPAGATRPATRCGATPGRSGSWSRGPIPARRRCATTTRPSAPCAPRASRWR